MVNNRKFIVSDELFSGFSQIIDLDEIDTIEEIIKIVYSTLHELFKKNNLDILLNTLKTKKFHIHDYTLENVLLSDSNDVFYICCHC